MEALAVLSIKFKNTNDILFPILTLLILHIYCFMLL